MSETRVLSASARTAIPPAPLVTGENPNILEIAAIDGQRRRLGQVSLAAIVVSFVHMASALILFSSASWIEQGAALGMTALVDWATWVVAEYLDYARRRGLTRSWWVRVLFGFALLISMFLNGSYLWAHRPAEDVLPGWMSGGIAIAFAVFTPLLIAVASLARGELTDDRLQLQQGARAEASALADLASEQGRAAQLEGELRTARAELAHLRAELAQVADRAAQLERDGGDLAAQRAQAVAHAHADLAQAVNRTAQLEAELAHERAGRAREAEESAQLAARVAQLERDGGEAVAHERAQAAQLRAALAEAEEQVAQLLRASQLDPLRVAQRLIALGQSKRQAAEFVGLKESTLRSRLSAQGA